jgi:hypothetical protein
VVELLGQVWLQGSSALLDGGDGVLGDDQALGEFALGEPGHLAEEGELGAYQP